MADLSVETMLSFYCLTGPLILNPENELEKLVNKMQLKYRTYIVEGNIEDGYVKLPNMFVEDFGDELGSYARLTDPKHNEFEVLVEKFNGSLYLTKGWLALRDFYGITLGTWISLVYIGRNQFCIVIKDRFHKTIQYPTFVPPMRFRVNKADVIDFVVHGFPTPYQHDMLNFQFTYEKKLDSYDVTSGFLMMSNRGFCDLTLDRGTTPLGLVDECGNKWNCTLLFGLHPNDSVKIGGQWKRMIVARNIKDGMKLLIGAPFAGSNHTLYFIVYRD